MDKRATNGGHSTAPQRPDDKRLLTKTELQDAYENLKPFLPDALKCLEKAIKAGKNGLLNYGLNTSLVYQNKPSTIIQTLL